MQYLHQIEEYKSNPQALEELYQAALKQAETTEFRNAIETIYASDVNNLALAAWHHRLAHAQVRAETPKSRNWKLAVPLSMLTGLILWLISDESYELMGLLPYVLLYWAPIAALTALVFFKFSQEIIGPVAE